MSDDLDIRSGGLVAIDTDTLRHVAATLVFLAARLDEAATALGRAGVSSLAAGLWVPAPEGAVRDAERRATDIAQALRALADVYELAEREATARIQGLDRDAGTRTAAMRLQARSEVAVEATRLAVEWGQGRHRDIERQMRDVHAMLGAYAPPVPALTLLTGAVRGVGRGTVAADAPPLRPIGAAASVVELSRHRAAGPDAAPRGLVQLLERLPGEDGIAAARVRVEEYRFASGRREFMVYIAGTRAFFDPDEPWDMTSNLQLYFGEESSSYLAVARAVTAAGALADDRLHIVGHSQGAMVGAHLARQGGFEVVTQIGFGSPIQADLPGDTLAVAVRHTDDPVATLSAGGLPGVSGSPDSAVVEREVDPAPTWSDLTFAVHHLDAYRDTAAAADASGDRRVALLRDRLAPLAGAVAVTSTVYGARRGQPAPPSTRSRPRAGGL